MTDIADGNMRSGAPVAGIARHRTLPPLWRAVVIALTAAACLLSVNHIFNLGFLTGHVLLDNQYQYALVGLLVPIVFLIFPATAKGDMNRIPCRGRFPACRAPWPTPPPITSCRTKASWAFPCRPSPIW